MEQKHVSKELAQKLKQIGFDWPVTTYWFEHKPKGWMEDESPFNEAQDYNKSYSWHLSRPTIETAASWLREVKGVHVVVDAVNGKLWTCQLRYINTGEIKNIGMFQSHDTALTHGIEHAVDYELKKQNDALGKPITAND